MQKRTLYIIGGVVGFVILACLGCLAFGLIGSSSPTVKATMTAQAQSRAVEATQKASRATEAVRPTDTREVMPAPTQSSQFTTTPLPVIASSPTIAPTATRLLVSPTVQTVTPERVKAQVSRVIDGDTIEVLIDGKAYTVRYIGMDTPETVAPGRPVEWMGLEASVANKALVESKTVYLEKDVSETDKYSRLLRYVFVGDLFVNAELVKRGLAQVSTYPPDVKYQALFLEMQQEARAAGHGLWGAKPTPIPQPTVTNVPKPTATLLPPTVPSVPNPTAIPTAVIAVATATSIPPVAAGCPQGCITPPLGCLIKGNISQDTGEKIYHVPGGAFYDKTVINPSAGERWFCTEQEAIANGWRRSQR